MWSGFAERRPQVKGEWNFRQGRWIRNPSSTSEGLPCSSVRRCPRPHGPKRLLVLGHLKLSFVGLAPELRNIALSLLRSTDGAVTPCQFYIQFTLPTRRPDLEAFFESFDLASLRGPQQRTDDKVQACVGTPHETRDMRTSKHEAP
jgi:hypothetical protein